MPKMKVYFAHPYPTYGTLSEDRIMSELRRRGFQVYNPFTDELHSDSEYLRRIRDGEYTRHDARRLVENDMAAIQRVDIVLAWLPENTPSVGTTMEIVYAVKAKKHVIVIQETDRDCIHPWIAYHANEVYPNITCWEAGIEHVCPDYGPSIGFVVERIDTAPDYRIYCEEERDTAEPRCGTPDLPF